MALEFTDIVRKRLLVICEERGITHRQMAARFHRYSERTVMRFLNGEPTYQTVAIAHQALRVFPEAGEGLDCPSCGHHIHCEE